MRTTYRHLVVITAVAVMMMGMAIPAFAGPEGTLISRINSSRASAGLSPVEGYWDLTDDARSHSARMMDKGEIYHNSGLSSVTGVWQALGENVGVGVDLGGLHNAFMSSPSHRGNILGDYNYVGVGVKTDDQGANWVTVIFMKAAPGLNGGDTTTTTTPPPTTTTTTTPPPTTPTTTAPLPATTTTTAPAAQEQAPQENAKPAKASGSKASARNAAVTASARPANASDGPIGVGGKLNLWD